MRLFRLGYSTNVHPGDDLDGVLETVSGPVARVREARDPRALLGVELWLSRSAVADLRATGTEPLARALEDAGCHCFALNAFPFGDFHAERVKEEVFRPSWLEPARLEYTLEAARVLADLLPRGGGGAVSTLPGTLKADARGEETRETVARAFLEAVAELARLRQATGRTIRLAVEPEPLGLLETTDEVITFWSDQVRPAIPDLASALGASDEEARSIARRHLGVCLDTCHQAVEWESVAASYERLTGAGVPVHKVHLSAGMTLSPPAEDPAALREAIRLDAGRYLHQAIARGEDGLHRIRDLAELDPDDPPEGVADRPLRVHFHVPIFAERHGGLGTTRRDLEAAIRAIVRDGGCRDLVCETYTWEMLVGEDEEDGEGGDDPTSVEDGIARELRWAHERIEEAGGTVA